MGFSSVIVANRGEIAVRLIRGIHDLKLKAIAVYTEDDATAPHVKNADEAYQVSDYNDASAVVAAAVATKADAVIPGYGFIAENAEAARAFEKAGVTWIGPTPESIDEFGEKTRARELAIEAKVPVLTGSGACKDADEAVAAAEKIGYPVLIKAAAGGGGMGQASAKNSQEMTAAYERVRDQADTLFGGGSVFVERYIERARHIEVQVIGDGNGKVVALGLRECSIQRRRQKVIEESPPASLPSKVAKAIADCAASLCAAHNYRNVGTVEFVLDAKTLDFFFLEVNTRLQVEHTVTEMCTGVDLVHCMLKLAMGDLKLPKRKKDVGAAIEVRVYAENPAHGFSPSPGILTAMSWPAEGRYKKPLFWQYQVRVDSWATRGATISTKYDPLLGKVIVHGSNRKAAIIGMKKALADTIVRGLTTNIEAVEQILDHEEFVSGNYTTSLLGGMKISTTAIEVLKPGLQSSIQDYPGRVGYWDVGVSPSGSMDSYSMNVANALVGNPLGSAALEMTVRGPTLAFHCDTVIALTGARFHAEFEDGKPVPWWTPFSVAAGSILALDGAPVVTTEENLDDDDDDDDLRFARRGGGKICYLAVRGGFDAAEYLGSKSTFPTGNFGGEHGRFLKAGDFLTLTRSKQGLAAGWKKDCVIPEGLIPQYNGNEWVVGALNGPHASADFFQEETISGLWKQSFKVHHAANRLGVRLIGQAPKWTRSDGGSAGLHPSNLHDYTYAPGAVNYSGNTPIVLMLDGPSLGGFVCPITVTTAELWKVAQAPPGASINFQQISYDDARGALNTMRKVWDAIRSGDEAAVKNLVATWSPQWVQKASSDDSPAIIDELDPARGDKAEMKVVYRMSGDEHVLIEYGEIKLDLAYRLRIGMLMDNLKPRDEVKELCPGVRSVLVRYDADKVHVSKFVSMLKSLEQGVLGSIDSVSVPSRVIHLPLAFDCQWSNDAMERYARSVRPKAPYLPSNVEFVRRMNGLGSVDEVRDIMLAAEYCVLGLGDVYLGAPCAVPIDPRHRLISTKMAPARLFTHEGTVGIGGAYMCIYGMDSPGGYQLMGRTIPIWDSYGNIAESLRGAPGDVPWLLRFFDRVSFYLVEDEQLEELRAKYKQGKLKLKIEQGTLSYKDYVEFCKSNAESIEEFEKKQAVAFEEERARWEEAGEADGDASATHAARENTTERSRKEEPPKPYCVRVRAGVSGNLWAQLAKDGEKVKAGQALFTVESMKVELEIEAPIDGILQNVAVAKGDILGAEDTLCEVQTTKEMALGDMSLAHLRSMYKLGVLIPKNVASTCVGGETIEDSPDEAKLKKDSLYLEKSAGRRFLPLYGAPFAVKKESGGGGDLSEVVRALSKAGGMYIGTVESEGEADKVVVSKGACFSVCGLQVESTSPSSSFSDSKKYRVLAANEEDAKCVLEVLNGM